MAEWIAQTMASLGYLGIGLLMFLENLFPPIPSELIMPLAGFTAAQGKLELVPAIAAGVIGTVLGALPWYYVGVVLGENRIKSWLGKYGKWIGISVEELDKTQRWFGRHGTKAIFWGRLVPVIRTLVSLPAGFSRVTLPTFLVFSTLGITAWTALLTFLGYKLGQNYGLVEKYIYVISKGVVAAILITFGFWLYRVIRRNRRTN
jgi:membrane protein DedA with SNARE-associated domain